VSAGSPRAMSPLPSMPGTAQQHAVDSLRWLIIAGALRPGQRVNQEDLAEHVGLSVAPIREALRTLEQEGQLTYLPRRGYFVTELHIEDLEEIYELRQVLEERAARRSLPTLDDDALTRIGEAAADCRSAAEAGNVAAELSANRRFHLSILEAPDQPHIMRLIRLLWDSTEAYRAMYYNSPQERIRSLDAHERILAAVRLGDPDLLVAELDAHRARALDVLRDILPARAQQGRLRRYEHDRAPTRPADLRQPWQSDGRG
jgi:DNA-binding GntR family transcriptional regulator